MSFSSMVFACAASSLLHSFLHPLHQDSLAPRTSLALARRPFPMKNRRTAAHNSRAQTKERLGQEGGILGAGVCDFTATKNLHQTKMTWITRVSSARVVHADKSTLGKIF